MWKREWERDKKRKKKKKKKKRIEGRKVVTKNFFKIVILHI